MSLQTKTGAPAEELNPFKIAQQQFDAAADHLDLDDSMRQLLKNARLERPTRRYAFESAPIIGPDRDIPAPDVYTDEQTTARIMDTISVVRGHTEPGVVTGKPVAPGGSLGRCEATARGCLYAVREACRVRGIFP